LYLLSCYSNHGNVPLVSGLFNYQGPAGRRPLRDSLFIISHRALFVKHFFEIFLPAAFRRRCLAGKLDYINTSHPFCQHFFSGFLRKFFGTLYTLYIVGCARIYPPERPPVALHAFSLRFCPKGFILIIVSTRWWESSMMKIYLTADKQLTH